MTCRFAAILTVLLLALPAAARADSFDPISIGAHAGTLGYGLTLERPLLYDLSARIETGQMSVSQSAAFDGTSYVQINHYSNVLLALQWRPSGFRFGASVGVLLGSDHVDYIARDDLGPYTINNTVYPVAAAGRVAARVSFDRPALYLGIGTGTGIVRGFAFTANFGIVVRNGTSIATASGPAANTPGLQRDLAALAGEFRTHIISPAISVGATFRP